MSMGSLQASLDGGFTWVDAKDIRVRASDPDMANQVHLTITNQGVKTDVVFGHAVLSTDEQHFFEIIAALV